MINQLKNQKASMRRYIMQKPKIQPTEAYFTVESLSLWLVVTSLPQFQRRDFVLPFKHQKFKVHTHHYCVFQSIKK